jgi:nucleoside phosphorylase
MNNFKTIVVDDNTIDLPKIDILLVTAVDVERDAVIEVLEPLMGYNSILKITWSQNTYFVGQLGKVPIVLVLGEAGTSGRQGSALLVDDSIKRWYPRAVIMVGIACGKETDGQIIGDVLVSTQVIPYEISKLTESGEEDRSHRPRKLSIV